MKATDSRTLDPVVRGLLSAGNVVAAVALLLVWLGKSTFSSDVWPMAFVLALVPLRGDVHQRFWDYARTEWLHAAGFVSRARLATACVAQEVVEALLRAGVIVLLTVQIRSTPKSASLYSWLTLGTSSWIGMLAAWAGVLLLVRASWSLAVNLDTSRVSKRRSKPAVRRNDASEDSFGPLVGFMLLDWIILAVALVEFARGKMWPQEQGASTHVRGSVPVRLFVATMIAAPPCALGLWLERAWIPAVFGVGVLVLLWVCVREKEFATSFDDAEARESASGSTIIEHTPDAPPSGRLAPRGATSRVDRSSAATSAAPRPSLARILLWKQVDRRNLLGIGVLLLLVPGLRWSVGGLPVPDEEQSWWVILVFVLLFVPGRLFRWTSTGEQAEFLVAHGRRLAWLRRAELTAGLGLLAVMAALCCLLVAGAPRSWAEWTCLLVASAQALIACNPSPITTKWRVRDVSTSHGVTAGIVLALFLSDAGESGMSMLGFGLAAASFLIAASLWLHGWWCTFDEAELRANEMRFAERA